MSNAFETAWSCFSVTLEGRVAHIRLNRPDAYNAMNRAFWNELPAIVRDIDDNARARAIVISSTGKHFSAGMDLQNFAGVGEAGARPGDRWVQAEASRHHLRSLQDTFSCLDEARVPVIAAIQGGCIGGGVDLTSACDIRYASADAFFCVQEINIGMTADAGTFPRLCKLIPQGWVRELAYTGRRMPAAQALQIGLVNAVLPDHEAVVAHALAAAAEIATKAPLAVAGSKVMINHAREHGTAASLDYLGAWQAGMFAGPHMAEAFKAKQEGREPDFPDLVPIHRGM
ncbi:MAG: crotonase/enoyl-CoA hydratase family protein [Phenylobacterium sp.]|uniref:crotonase/enoyl-CoA hydratase family protein n=1 Tax=Phenylobacterium sp. TaxID=1871053 RepID=UPI00120C469F|nr:crotonase/enoyl-CoA hydratase family protein [Phenylobacterium sp.]TAL38126.1 MAG: crotonase/enoyl-CoA hydratase family protein [Phenylobacterium sp.]